MYILGPVDMKRKYKAEWALVTGAGTGIGKSIAETMAMQGLNVVLVSLPDKFLDDTTASLQTAFPKQQFRKVAAKFDHKTDYMPAIIEVYYTKTYLDNVNSFKLHMNCRPPMTLTLPSFSITRDI